METLEVDTAYFYPNENAKSHKTDKFELVNEEVPIPVLRRGLKFTIAIRFIQRSFDAKIDDLKITFSYGPRPNVIKGTKGVIKVSTDKINAQDDKFWYSNVLEKGENHLTLEIFAPPTIPIGVWIMEIETNRLNSTLPPKIYKYEDDIYFLFNPWLCQDLTYMPDQRLLDEYVLTDVGKIWVGPWGSSRGREWVFGQFDAVVLPAVMLMFEKSGMPHMSRGDPIKVSRMISKMVNSNDDDGILMGRWDGEYSDGTAPSAWTGSVPILEEYLETGSPVKYGQCWIFSGVVTTICRALGIPSRVVSNLVSAHDANATLTIDKYYDANDEELDYDPHNPMGEDSIWNYHVWNDVWMARPDLPKGYGGWQAIDATPQETSSGFYQCGPASLEAIRKGQVGFNYDVPFMVASVNADLMRWKEDPNHVLGYSRIYCNKYHIGRLILTKKPFQYDPNGDKDREDITTQYKPKEGTEAERLSLYNAVRGTESAKTYFCMPDPSLEDVEFDLQELERINIGEDFCVTIVVKNKSKEKRTINAVLSARSVYYTGVKAHLIKKSQGEFVMKPNSTETVRMSVKAEEYLDKLVEHDIMKLYAVANVKETRQTWADEDDFQVLKPILEVKIPSKIPLKKPTSITVQLKNPLKSSLSGCKFNIHGPSLCRNLTISYPNIGAGEAVKVETIILPKMAGEQKLVATFISKELHGVSGSASVNVVDK